MDEDDSNSTWFYCTPEGDRQSGWLYFDGTDDYVEFPSAVTADILGDSPRTVCLWAAIIAFDGGTLFSYDSNVDQERFGFMTETSTDGEFRLLGFGEDYDFTDIAPPSSSETLEFEVSFSGMTLSEAEDNEYVFNLAVETMAIVPAEQLAVSFSESDSSVVASYTITYLSESEYTASITAIAPYTASDIDTAVADAAADEGVSSTFSSFSTQSHAIVGGTAIEDDAWSIRGDDYFWQNFQHYCHTYDGTDWKFYFNGALAHTETVALDTGSDNPLTIGVRYSSGYSGYFNGKIDDVYVYSSALNAASIQVLYNDGAR